MKLANMLLLLFCTPGGSRTLKRSGFKPVSCASLPNPQGHLSREKSAEITGGFEPLGLFLRQKCN